MEQKKKITSRPLETYKARPPPRLVSSTEALTLSEMQVNNTANFSELKKKNKEEKNQTVLFGSLKSGIKRSQKQNVWKEKSLLQSTGLAPSRGLNV